MSKEMTVIALGIWVVILPHLGVTGFWHTVLTTLSGLAIVGVGLYLRTSALARIPRTPHHPFVENSISDIHHTHEERHANSGN